MVKRTNDLRELDTRLALALGWTHHDELKTPSGATYLQAWVPPDKAYVEFETPHYSTDPAAMLELDAEMWAKGWRGFMQRLDDGSFLSGYSPKNNSFTERQELNLLRSSATMPEAVARAAEAALSKGAGE